MFACMYVFHPSLGLEYVRKCTSMNIKSILRQKAYFYFDKFVSNIIEIDGDFIS